MSGDFFDEEYDKLQENSTQLSEQQNEQQSFVQQDFSKDKQHSNDDLHCADDWTDVKPMQQTRRNKPLTVVVTALALVFCIALGWVLCACFGLQVDFLTKRDEQKYADAIIYSLKEQGIEITDSQLQVAMQYAQANLKSWQQSDEYQREQILFTVFDYIYNNFLYDDIDTLTWNAAIANAGTMLLQTTGDQFSYLMSPSDHYVYDHGNATETVGAYGDEMFGMTFQYATGVGLHVTGISDNSSAFGVLKVGDYIVKLTDMQKISDYGKKTQSRVSLFVDGSADIVIANYSYEEITGILADVYSANFWVLRNGEVVQAPEGEPLERGKFGFEIKPEKQYDYVEYYFGDDCTNLSVANQYKARTNSKAERCLDNLPTDTGYVKLLQFGENADSEFAEVMNIFKARGLSRLILDLKGNPGGSVDVACNIIALLVTDEKLADNQRIRAVSGNQLTITTLVDRNGNSFSEKRSSSYHNYFGETSSVCDIVLWTDGNSASASELLTGCLLDYKTAIQMGARTYGKGIAQVVTSLPYNGPVYTVDGMYVLDYSWAIYYTRYSYYSPLGTNIHTLGYTPQQQYDGLYSYQDLWDKTREYWK